MGWLWASSSSSSSPPPPQQQQQHLSPSSGESSSKSSQAPNEPVDPEIQKFFDLLSAEAATPSEKAKPSSTSKTTTDSSSETSSSWFSLHTPKVSSRATPQDAPPLDPVAESLLPTDMSCRQAFDLAWACNGFGGQWNAVYRYGAMRSCSEQWDDFWFCMRTKSYTGDLKANMVKAHYRNKEHIKYGSGKPNSEDIWESRKQKLPAGAAFSESIDLPAVDDDKWRREENERRKRIRDGLGIDKPAP